VALQPHVCRQADVGSSGITRIRALRARALYAGRPLREVPSPNCVLTVLEKSNSQNFAFLQSDIVRGSMFMSSLFFSPMRVRVDSTFSLMLSRFSSCRRRSAVLQVKIRVGFAATYVWTPPTQLLTNAESGGNTSDSAARRFKALIMTTFMLDEMHCVRMRAFISQAAKISPRLTKSLPEGFNYCSSCIALSRSAAKMLSGIRSHVSVQARCQATRQLP
jgi:hypothetical protein